MRTPIAVAWQLMVAYTIILYIIPLTGGASQREGDLCYRAGDDGSVSAVDQSARQPAL